MNKTITISNLDKLPKKSGLKSGTSYVATLNIFVEKGDATDDIDPGWTAYYFQNKWKMKKKSSDIIDPKTQVKSYFGSSGGKKGKVSPEMLKAMKNSSMDVKITLNESVIKTNHAPFYESKLTTKHRQDNKKTCWNKNDASGGHHSYAIDMKSCIAYAYLSPLLLDMIDYLKEETAGQSPQILNRKQKIIRSIFKIGQISHEEIIEFIEKGLYIQSRESMEGNKARIAYYKEQMDSLFDWLLWQGYVIVLMDKNGNKTKILDGNESSRAMIGVPNMFFLKTIEIPYDFWKDLADQELQSLGNECNRPEVIRQDFCSIGDAENQIINLVVGHKLFTPKRGKNGGELPVMDHPILEERMDTLRMGIEELKIARNKVEKHFKDKKKKDDKTREGSFDFSSTARKIQLDKNGTPLPNNNLKAYNIRRQEIWDKHKGRFNEKNTFTISGGSALEGSIAKVFWQHYPLIPLPTTALFLLTFDLEKEYDEHEKKTKGTKKAIEFINSFFSIDIVVERLDPSADKSVC